MAEDQWERLGEVAVDHVEVACADAAGDDADERLALVRRRQLDVEDLDRPTCLPEHGSLHPHTDERTAPKPQNTPQMEP